MEYVYFNEYSKILCNNENLIYVKPLSIPITTTTTTLAPIDIYYGVSSNSRVTESEISSMFLRASGYVGSIDGRVYNFTSGYSYKYWCIPDWSNDGDKVIRQILNNSEITVLAYDSYYNNYQINPTPVQSMVYGKVVINGVTYRIYRTILKSSSYTEYYVYSF